MDISNSASSSQQNTRPSEMSYKFQRLREKLRVAIASGELAGKLPGERTLAKRFHVNAKTLSKALTDLAAEGLLDRSIGRGTYVRGTAPVASSNGRWLLLCDDNDSDAKILLDRLRQVNPETQATCEGADARPSFLNSFTAVIDAAAATPESFLRELVVRNLTLVAVGREARMYSMHVVLADIALGVARVVRDMILAGHRRFAAIESSGCHTVAQSLRQTTVRLAPDATIDVYSPDDVAQLRQSGATGVICASPAIARKVRTALARPVEADGTPGLHDAPALPAGISLAAVGIAWDEAPVSGYYVDGATAAEQIINLLKDPPAGRPAAMWMAGHYVERGTMSAGVDASVPVQESAPMRVQGVLV
jgi:hypothetical protein